MTRELLDERLGPAHHEDHGRHRAVLRRPSPAVTRGTRVALRVGTNPQDQENDRQGGENRDEHGGAQVRLGDEAPGPGGERESEEVAARDRPNQDEEEEERQQHAVRVPGLVEHLAAHGPGEDRRHRGGEGAEDRPAPPAREDRMPRTDTPLTRAIATTVPTPPPNSRTGSAPRSKRSGPGWLKLKPDVCDADEKTPSNGRWSIVNTSLARIGKNALSSVGIHPFAIARVAATTIGRIAAPTETGN